MTVKDFEHLARKRFEHCLMLMVGPKNCEYSRNDDKLHNFKVAGRVLNQTPERALQGMWIKHLVSIFDIIDDLDRGILPDPAILAEKVTDNINYPVLLSGLLEERQGQDTGKAVGSSQMPKVDKTVKKTHSRSRKSKIASGGLK
jgi:hypothetical protein